MMPNFLSTGTSRCPRFAARALYLAAFVMLLVSGSCRAQQHGASAAERHSLQTLGPKVLATASDAGPLAASTRLTIRLTLAPTSVRQVALQQFLPDLTTAGTSDYRKWLTPAEFASRFGGEPGQLGAVTAWAQAAGLTVDAVSPAGNRVTVSGFTAQMQNAFGVSLRNFQVNGTLVYAPADQPTLPAQVAGEILAIDGLDSLATSSGLTLGSKRIGFAGLADVVDTNLSGVLALRSSLCRADVTESELAEYQALFKQAAAQGTTTLVSGSCLAGGFPGALPEVTAVAGVDAIVETAQPLAARPGWQSVPGLPEDTLRHTPDVTAVSVSEFETTLASIAASIPQGRLGNINPVLYALAPIAGIFAQADGSAAGTWEPATGLGRVDLAELAEHFPRGTGTSFTSFSASNYSPVHGQSITFTASVTSGTGGATPSGTVSFLTADGATLGTATLAAGTGTFTTNTLSGGSYAVKATYTGDGSYASSSSPAGTVLVQPEAGQLAATVSTNNVVGGTFSVVVTDTAGSGVGTPTGVVTVMISGTNQSATATLMPSGANTSSATLTLAANTVGGQTLSINCTSDANFSCYNPLTKGLTITRATPTLNFTYTPNPAVSGGSITLNASLAAVGNAPVPSGNVEFFDGTTVLNAGTLKGGATTVIGTVPTTATHSISATYDGDANYNSVTVSGSSGALIGTATTLATSAASPPYGQGVTLTATVTPASGTTPPTGIVTFLDSVGGLLGKTSLANSTATLTTTALPGGVSSVTANYAGDSTHAPSVSGPVTETVQPEADQVTVQVPSNATFGSNVAITVTVTGSSSTGAASPTGSVTLTPSGTGYAGSYTSVLSSAGGNTGSATFTAPATAAGTVMFVATYTGDKNFAAGGPTTTTATVSKVSAATTLTLNPAQPATGQATILTATVPTIGSVGPAGTVTFTNGGVVIGTSSLNSNGIAALTTSFTAGNHELVAKYNGDSNYGVSTSPSVNSSTGTVSTSTTVVSPVSTVGSGKSFTLTINVAPSTLVANAQPTGSVQILDGGVVLGTAGLNNGTASLTTSLISVGTHSLVGYYSGDTNYAASTSPGVSIAVSTVTTTTALSASTYAINTGQSVTLSATIQPTITVNGTAPTGTVVFTAASQGLVGLGTVTNGVATFTTASLAAGNYSLTATYSGDGNYASSASTPATTLTVTALSNVAVLAATLSPTTAVAGTMAVVTASVTLPGTLAPTGSVLASIVLTGSTSNNTGLLVTGGTNSATATISLTVPPAGVYSVMVTCPANAGYTCNTITLPLTSTAPAKIVTSTVLTLTPAAPVAGTAATLTATISSLTTGAAAISGTVSFYSGTTLLGTGTVASGVATLSYTFMTSASQSLTAVFSGDTVYATSTSPAVSTTTALAPTTTTLTSNISLAITGGTVTLTAQVAGTVLAGTSPTGKVSFYVSGILPRLLGTATLSATGTGLAATSIFTTQIPAGQQTVYAIYSGDTTFQTSTSNLVGIGLTDYSATFTPATLTLTAGQSGNVAILITPSGGFTGVVSMNCVPPANASITCSIFPASLQNGGSSVLTINTVAPKLALGRGPAWPEMGARAMGGAVLAALLLWRMPGGRRRRRLPALLLVLLTISLGMGLGCGQGTFIVGTNGGVGTPLGTATLTINTSGSNGVTTITHDYAYQVTIQ